MWHRVIKSQSSDNSASGLVACGGVEADGAQAVIRTLRAKSKVKYLTEGPSSYREICSLEDPGKGKYSERSAQRWSRYGNN